MTKKDFIKLADVMRANKPITQYATEDSFYGHGLDQGRIDHWETLLEALAEMLAQSNPRFNRQRWLDYVNGECTANGGKLPA